jgi:2-C-methyl-D-erythritol 4-phosphate cytidylyltransferase
MLWHALTPQYFAASALKTALIQSRDNGSLITDDASAMENAGYSPMLVVGHEDNIKITRPDDLRLASLYLRSQKKHD